MHTGCRGNTMDYIVGQRVQPLAIVYLRIGGVGALNKSKGGDGLVCLFVNDNMTDTLLDVADDLLFGGMPIGPLSDITL